MTAENRPLYARIVGSPFLWGMAATACFFHIARLPQYRSPFVLRYFDGHFINRTEVAFFFIGLAALALTFLKLWGQRALLYRAKAHAIIASSETLPIVEWQEALQSWPQAIQRSMFGKRIAWALRYVARMGSTDGLRQELREQAASHSDMLYSQSALVKIIIWAIPILGFLGTVVGITIAIAELNPETLEQSMNKVTAGLAVAFDTTAIALVLSMILMFGQYANDQMLSGLLNHLDDAAESALVGRVHVPRDDHEESDWRLMRRTAERLAQGVKDSVELQRQHWQLALSQERERWNEATMLLLAKLENSLEQRNRQASESTLQALKQLHEHLIQEQKSAGEHAIRAVRDHQAAAREQVEALAQHTATLQRAMEAVNEIGGLETALNRNLKALSGASHFSRAVEALEQAVTLLRDEVGAASTKKIALLRHDDSQNKDRGLAA